MKFDRHLAAHGAQFLRKARTAALHEGNGVLAEFRVGQSGDRRLFRQNVERKRQTHAPHVVGNDRRQHGIAYAETGQSVDLGEGAHDGHVGKSVQSGHDGVLGAGKFDVCLVDHQQAGRRQGAGQLFQIIRRSDASGGVVGGRDDDERGVFIHQLEQAVEVKGEVGIQRSLTQLHAGHFRLRGIQTEAGTEHHGIVHAGHGAHTEQEVDDLVGTVAHENALRVHAVAGRKSLHQSRVARLRIAEGLAGAVRDDLAHAGRHAQRILVAGHFDDAGKAVALGDFRNAETGFVGFKSRHFGADVIERGEGKSHGESLQMKRAIKRAFLSRTKP